MRLHLASGIVLLTTASTALCDDAPRGFPATPSSPPSTVPPAAPSQLPIAEPPAPLPATRHVAVPVPHPPSAWDPPPPRPTTETRWYGWQTLFSDGFAVFAVEVFVTSPGGDPKLLILGASSYFLGAPIIHLAHAHVGKAAASFAMRALPWTLYPLAGVGSCARADSSAGSSCGGGVPIAAVLILASIPIAILVDAAGLAVDEKPARETAWAPTLSLARGRVDAGIGGVF